MSKKKLLVLTIGLSLVACSPNIKGYKNEVKKTEFDVSLLQSLTKVEEFIGEGKSFTVKHTRYDSTTSVTNYKEKDSLALKESEKTKVSGSIVHDFVNKAGKINSTTTTTQKSGVDVTTRIEKESTVYETVDGKNVAIDLTNNTYKVTSKDAAYKCYDTALSIVLDFTSMLSLAEETGTKYYVDGAKYTMISETNTNTEEHSEKAKISCQLNFKDNKIEGSYLIKGTAISNTNKDYSVELSVEKWLTFSIEPNAGSVKKLDIVNMYNTTATL